MTRREIEMYIGDDLYTLDVEGDREEIFLPNVVKIERGDFNNAMDYVTLRTMVTEFALNSGCTEENALRALEDAAHEKLLEAFADDYEAARESYYDR